MYWKEACKKLHEIQEKDRDRIFLYFTSPLVEGMIGVVLQQKYYSIK